MPDPNSQHETPTDRPHTPSKPATPAVAVDAEKSRSDRVERIRWAGWVAGTACVVLPLYAFLARQGGGADTLVLAQTAKSVLDGKRLYAGAWTDKPPLAVAVYTIPEWCVPRSYRAIEVFAALLWVAAAAMYAYAFRGCFAAMLGCMLLVTLFPLSDADYVWPASEIVCVAPVLLIGARVASRNQIRWGECLAAGFFACLAFHVRETAVCCMLIPLLAIGASQRARAEKVRGVIALGAGALLGAVVVALFVIARGSLSGYVEFMFVDPLGAPANVTLSGAWYQFVALLWSGPLPAIVALFGILAARREDAKLISALFVVGTLATLGSIYELGHYWVALFPYAVLLVGLGIQRVGNASRPMARMLALGLALALVPMAGLRADVARRSAIADGFYKVAEAADRAAPEGATLLVCGPAPAELIQFASRMPVAQPIWAASQMQPPALSRYPRAWSEIQEDYFSSPPGVLVVHENYLRAAVAARQVEQFPPSLQLVAMLIDRHRYNVVATVEGYVILVRAKD